MQASWLIKFLDEITWLDRIESDFERECLITTQEKNKNKRKKYNTGATVLNSKIEI